MIRYAYGVASGMAYLHHQLWPYELHCDLAARNCLVGPNYGIKIGDFGKIDYTNYGDCYYEDSNNVNTKEYFNLNYN
jgi:serine/threonine protein kinase